MASRKIKIFPLEMFESEDELEMTYNTNVEANFTGKIIITLAFHGRRSLPYSYFQCP